MMSDERFAELATVVGISADLTAEVCPCGCGQATKWNFKRAGAGFKPGHDARLVSILLASARAYGKARLDCTSVDGLISIHDARQMLMWADLNRLEIKLMNLWLGLKPGEPQPEPTP